MKPIIKLEEFINNNKQAFNAVTEGKRLRLPRSKPRCREEFLAIGQAILEAIKTAEEEGNFMYNPEKGLKIRWKP